MPTIKLSIAKFCVSLLPVYKPKREEKIMIYFPHCKINIGLNVIEKRLDGFHNIASIFYPLPIKDSLEMRPTTKKEMTFTISGLEIKDGNQKENIVITAYNMLKNDFPNMPSLDIHLHKEIPSQAGLGGGSSDAAFALKLMDKVCELNISEEDMKNYALRLGSDCYFFLQDDPMLVRGRGDLMSKTNLSLEGYWINLFKIQAGYSTKIAYENIKPHVCRLDYDDLGEMKTWKKKVRNVFEDVVFKDSPELKLYKNYLYEYGALYVSMTGSGTTLYAISEEKLDLKALQHSSRAFVWQQKL
jgi:4-diphosphocytidyl-2-C-methyl-D-erythritol kinase